MDYVNCTAYIVPLTFPKSRPANGAMRCAYCTLRFFVNLQGWLSAEPCQGNKRGDLRPDSANALALYRECSFGVI